MFENKVDIYTAVAYCWYAGYNAYVRIHDNNVSCKQKHAMGHATGHYVRKTSSCVCYMCKNRHSSSHLFLYIMACTVHYDNYIDNNEELNPLTKEKYDRLLLAVASPLELGGGNLHEVQSSQIPKQYVGNLVVHDKCYKNFIGAISDASKNVPSTSKASEREHGIGDGSYPWI